jgi:hypothetical protein
MHVAPPANEFDGGFRIPLGGTADGYDAAAWLGCATGSATGTWSDVSGLLAAAGLKAYCVGSGSSPAGYDVRLEHYWAGIVLDGYLYYLDPCFKPRRITPHRDILADAGYSRSSLLAAAGGSIGPSHVQGLSAGALGAALDQLAARLASTWHAADPVAAPRAFIGGDSVVPQDIHEDAYPFHGTVEGEPIDFLAQPDSWKNDRRTALTVTHGTASKTLWLDEVATRHVWISYTDSPGHAYPGAVLHVDDETVLAESAGSAQAAVTLTLAVDHAYPDASMSAPYDLVRATTNTYVIVLGMGGDHPGGMRARAATELARARAADGTGVAARARALQSVGQQWLAQTALVSDLAGRLGGVRRGFFYNIGIAGQSGSPYVDLKNCFTYTCRRCPRVSAATCSSAARSSTPCSTRSTPRTRPPSRPCASSPSPTPPARPSTSPPTPTTPRPCARSSPTTRPRSSTPSPPPSRRAARCSCPVTAPPSSTSGRARAGSSTAPPATAGPPA